MLNQFSRTELLIGKEGMEKLKNSRVAVFGIGGVGGYTVEALVRSGVGTLDLIDDDKVCLTNINRQIYATRKTGGKQKGEVARDRILEINPDAVVNIHKTFYVPETADSFDFSQYDYVDGIATMQIQNLNALVDTVRHEIIERYRPGEDDPHLKVLQAAHISDDEYFSHMVLDDLNLIIRDIRETHKKDSESAPQTTVANELKENLEAVENFKGSRLEKLAVLYCKQLGINYKNLSDEEFRWLIRILKKSKKMGTPISQRKKR